MPREVITLALEGEHEDLDQFISWLFSHRFVIDHATFGRIGEPCLQRPGGGTEIVHISTTHGLGVTHVCEGDCNAESE